MVMMMGERLAEDRRRAKTKHPALTPADRQLALESGGGAGLLDDSPSQGPVGKAFGMNITKETVDGRTEMKLAAPVEESHLTPQSSVEMSDESGAGTPTPPQGTEDEAPPTETKTETPPTPTAASPQSAFDGYMPQETTR